MKFLCDKHRDLLQQFPSIAQARWDDWMNRGYAALESNQWSIAITHFGCCYEISEMMLAEPNERQQIDNLSGVDRLMLSGHLLAESLGRSGNATMERHYLLAVHHHLTKPVPSRFQGAYLGLRKNLEISLLMLKRHCRMHGEFSGFEACLNQAARLLNQSQGNFALH